jgi:hypothetical protein
MFAEILFSTKIMARTRARVAATAKTIHTPSRMFSMILQAAKLNNKPAMDTKANTINNNISPDNSKVDMTSKVDMSSPSPDSLLDKNHRITQTAIMAISRPAIHMVRALCEISTAAVLMLHAEMGAMNGHNVSPRDPNAILNACREVDRGIDSIEGNLEELTRLRAQADGEIGDEAQLETQIDTLSGKIMEFYSALVGRVRMIRSDPESGSLRNAPQVGRVKRRLEHTMRQYQQIGLDARNKKKAQIERSIRIAHPEATEDQIREAVEDPQGGQVFANAVRAL